MTSRTRFRLSCAAGFFLAVILHSETSWAEQPGKPVQIDLATPPAEGFTDPEKALDFWSFRPVAQQALPRVEEQSWAKTPVDRFVLARLESQNLVPVEPANRWTWLRRVTFDLIGFPPSLADAAAFVNDNSPNAHQKVVDRLLSSPHYGERWARYWLDVARYAEEQHHPSLNQFETLADAYKYRDWVVTALNQDLPTISSSSDRLPVTLLRNSARKAGRLSASWPSDPSTVRTAGKRRTSSGPGTIR